MTTVQYTHKKSLGQHFLHDESICIRIVDTLNHYADDLLEIGPGAGAITKYLLQKPFNKYLCIELDNEKVIYLKNKYPLISQKIIHEDFLKAQIPFDSDFAIIGNFPYNISTQILFKVLEWKSQVHTVVGMFQKEVAERVVAKHGNKTYGILSVLIQCFYDVEYLFDVPPTCFTPAPKVMSGVIRLKRKEKSLFEGSEKKFIQFVKIAFNQRRKTLRNGFKSYYPNEKLQNEIFNKRAEQLSVRDFVDLFHELNPPTSHVEV